MAKKTFYKKKPADIAFIIVNTILLTIMCIVTLYPVLNTVAVSFNEAVDTLTSGVYLWPRNWTLENYKAVLRNDGILVGLKNSALRTIIATLAHTFVTAFTIMFFLEGILL